MDTRYLHNKPSSGFSGKWSGGKMMNRITSIAANSAKLILAWGVTTSVAMATNLVDMKFSSLPGGSFEAQLVFDAPPPTPQGYTIEKPARIALDLPGVTSQLKEKKQVLGYENASSAVILESTGRTRADPGTWSSRPRIRRELKAIPCLSRLAMRVRANT